MNEQSHLVASPCSSLSFLFAFWSSSSCCCYVNCDQNSKSASKMQQRHLDALTHTRTHTHPILVHWGGKSNHKIYFCRLFSLSTPTRLISPLCKRCLCRHTYISTYIRTNMHGCIQYAMPFRNCAVCGSHIYVRKHCMRLTTQKYTTYMHTYIHMYAHTYRRTKAPKAIRIGKRNGRQTPRSYQPWISR